MVFQQIFRMFVNIECCTVMYAVNTFSYVFLRRLETVTQKTGKKDQNR